VRPTKEGGVRATDRDVPAVEAGGDQDKGGGSRMGIEGRLTRGPDPI
jgi:hypothetical protein